MLGGEEKVFVGGRGLVLCLVWTVDEMDATWRRWICFPWAIRRLTYVAVRCNNDGSAVSWGERRWSSMELEHATVLLFSEIVEVVRVPSASICALSPRSTVDKQVIDVLTVWTRCPKGFVNTSSASQLHEVLEQVIQVPYWPCVFSLSGTGAESNFWALASVACAGACVSRGCSGVPMTLCDEELSCAFACATSWRCCTRCYGSREAAKRATPPSIPPICTSDAPHHSTGPEDSQGQGESRTTSARGVRSSLRMATTMDLP